MSDIVERLRKIDAASRRDNGTQIPLGECLTEAAETILALRVRVAVADRALIVARETIQIERDHLVDCCTVGGDERTLEAGAKPDVHRMDAALAAIDAALKGAE